MSYWGITQQQNHGPTWWLRGGRSGPLNYTTDLAANISQGTSTRKWSNGRNPIPAEGGVRDVSLPPKLMTDLKKEEYAQLYETHKNNKAFYAGLGVEQAKGMDARVEANLKQHVIHGFKNFLLGEGSPEDYARVGWWPTDANGKLQDTKPDFLKKNGCVSRHPSVLNWLEKEIDEQVAYKRDLTKLKMMAQAPGALSLDELWKVYKFLSLGGSSDDHLKEFYTPYDAAVEAKISPDVKATEPPKYTGAAQNEERETRQSSRVKAPPGTPAPSSAPPPEEDQEQQKKEQQEQKEKGKQKEQRSGKQKARKPQIRRIPVAMSSVSTATAAPTTPKGKEKQVSPPRYGSGLSPDKRAEEATLRRRAKQESPLSRQKTPPRASLSKAARSEEIFRSPLIHDF